MRVWKLQACRNAEWIGSRRGYALAETAERALELAKATSGLHFNRVFEKHPAMLWPGTPGQRVAWD